MKNTTHETEDPQEPTPPREGERAGQEVPSTPTEAPQVPVEDNWQQRYIRLYAEFENSKKRQAREQHSWYRMANKSLILALLPTLDNLTRAIESMKGDDASQHETKEGLNLILTNLQKCLEEQGLQPIQVEVGQEPNPQEHHVLTKVATDNEAHKGKIVEVITTGYALHEQVLRHAQVIIGA